MNEEIKAEWIKRLRSGEYKQGRNTLKRKVTTESGTEDEYCCLGILQDIAVEKGVANCKFDSDISGYLYLDAENPSTYLAYGDDGYHTEVEKWEGGVLTPGARHWAGLDESNPVVSGYPFNTLAGMNDRARWSFGQIADAIEESL